MDKEGFYAVNRALAEAGIAGRVVPVPGENDHAPWADIYTNTSLSKEELHAALGAAGLFIEQHAQHELHTSDDLPRLSPGTVYYKNCGCDDCPGTARHTFEDRNNHGQMQQEQSEA